MPRLVASCNLVCLVIVGLTLTVQTADGAEPLAPREIASGVWVHGSSARLGSANIAWIIDGDEAWILGIPHPELVQRAIQEVKQATGRAPSGAILTEASGSVLAALPLLASERITLFGHPSQFERLKKLAVQKADVETLAGTRTQSLKEQKTSPAASRRIEILQLGQGDAGVWLPQEKILYSGRVCVNGPRAPLPESDTAKWIDELADLEHLEAKTVVPAAGTMGDAAILSRQRGFLLELRRQIAHLVAQGVPHELVRAQVSIAPQWLVWMPYDQPTVDDIDHVYSELTVPIAPFGPAGFADGDQRPRALALIGDGPHDPAHLQAGLKSAFDAAQIHARFAFDVRSLSAENLAKVQLLVMLRDGMHHPGGASGPTVMWMTSDQEAAVVKFVESGGALLALHNSTGLYPDDGPYLKLLGGTYQGHGPLERFRVDVIDPAHPITAGVASYEAADEQHTPTPDLTKVHPLLASRPEDGVVATAGWAYEPGRGRVAYLASGHTREALSHPMYQRLLVNATRWWLENIDRKAASP